MNARIRTAALVLFAAFLTACGSRGAPLPPVYPNPPAITGLTATQRGAFAILRFPEPQVFVTVGAEDVELEDVEILVYAERYPVLTAETLIAALQRRAEVMRLDAAAEAAAARALAARQEVEQRAAEEGREPPPPDPDAPPTTVTRRSPDDEALYRVPRDILEEWRSEGLPGDAILNAATKLATAVDELWSDLDIAATVIDPSQSILLPDPGEIAAASTEIVERTTYERPLAVGPFLARAAVSHRIEVDQFDELLVDEQLQVAIPVGTPSTGGLRTRYFFAARGSSTRDTPGIVNAVVSLAPAAVPVAPTNVVASVGPQGVELTWTPPAGDIALRRLSPDAVSYNIYRMAPEGIAGPTPLNPQPVRESEYIDTSAQWGEEYVYEVRALRAPPAATAAPAATPTTTASTRGPRRESESARTAEVSTVDAFAPAPPSDVIPTRAGNIVNLRWTPSSSLDIVGYRVYRHPFPAPDLPLRFDPLAEEGDPAATAEPAVQDPEGPNELVEAGWELLTPEPVPFSRYTDDADPATRFVYAVEAIDAAGNLSALALGIEPGDNNR